LLILSKKPILNTGFQSVNSNKSLMPFGIEKAFNTPLEIHVEVRLEVRIWELQIGR